MKRRAPLAVALLCIGLFPTAARAQGLDELPPSSGDQSALREGFGSRRPFWESGETRGFVASTLELGAIYFRPNLHIGYGKPHLRWVGVEGYSGLSPAGSAMYGGARFVLPALSLRAGSRFVTSLGQSFIQKKETYAYDDTEIDKLRSSRYLALEGEAVVNVPVPGGEIIALGTGYSIQGVPDDDYAVFEEALHVVVHPPWAWRGRLGFLGHPADSLKLGGAFEIIGLPGREEYVLRTGPAVVVSLTHHLSMVGALMVVVRSPDSLGLRGADFGQLGFQYRWATGDRWPEFP